MKKYVALASQDDAHEVQVWHTRNNHPAGLLSGLSAHNSITMANRFITPSSTCFNQVFIREIHIIESRNGQQTIHRRL